MIIHQSDLGSFGRCAAAFGYQLAGLPRRQTSALAFGTVMHYALEVLETERLNGASMDSALEKATETFLWYWNPANIEVLTEPVSPDGWIMKQSYNGLRAQGVRSLKQYAAMVRDMAEEILALEFSFQVPIQGTWDEELGEPHVLVGTIDRLTAKYMRGYDVLGFDDYKTGKQSKYLRQNLQFTAYAYASTQKEFWVGWRGEDGFRNHGEALYERFKDSARHGRWINMKDISIADAGFRGPLDYHRLAVAVEQFAASVKAEIFPLTLVGEVCTFCDYRAVCAGSGVARDDHGAPWEQSEL